MNGIFINHTNHPSTIWLTEQKLAAEKYGKIIEFPFPNIDPEWDEDTVWELAEENCRKIMELQPTVVLCQGEFLYCYDLINLLKNKGVVVLSACSKRVVTEWEENGQKVKKAAFVFVRFRKY